MHCKIERLVAIGLIVLFIFIVLVVVTGKDQDADLQDTQTTTRIHYTYPSYDNRACYTYKRSYPNTKSSTNRTEILNMKLKGYRESTYWGSEHPIDVKVRYMNDDEFNRYVSEEVVQKDASTYWGAEY